MPTRNRRTAVLALALSVAVLAPACSADDDADDDATLGDTAAPTPPTVPEALPPSPTGTGVVVVGGSTSSFAVVECRLEPDPAEPEAARALVSLEGAGTTGSGAAFTVELQRFATGLNDVVTYTDTVTYTDSARILQAQRIEVGGQVTDLRDADAASPLVRTRDDGLSAAGLAGAPGDGPDDEGIIGLALDASC
ncbi:MAG: hypothetical protein ABWZ76_11925 [Acidimicrobiales bacterium]